MRGIGRILLIIALGELTSGAEILCNDLKDHSFDENKEIPYGGCILLNPNHEHGKLKIKLRSENRGEIPVLTILPKTIYTIPRPFGTHFNVQDLIQFAYIRTPYHALTEYIPKGETHQITICTPLECQSFSSHEELFLLPSSISNRSACPGLSFVDVDFPSPNEDNNPPLGVCVLQRKPSGNDYITLFSKTPQSLFYLSLKPLDILTRIDHRKRYPREKTYYLPDDSLPELPSSSLTPSTYPFHIRDFSREVQGSAVFSVTANFFPLHARSNTQYIIKTPRKVFTLVEEKKGVLSLFDDTGDNTINRINVKDALEKPLSYPHSTQLPSQRRQAPPSLPSTGKSDGTGQQVEERETAVISSSSANKTVEKKQDNYVGESRLLIQCFSDTSLKLPKESSHAWRYSALFHKDYGYEMRYNKMTMTGAYALMRFLSYHHELQNFPINEQDGDSRNLVSDVELAYYEGGETFLYSYKTLLRNLGDKAKLLKAKILTARKRKRDWDHEGEDPALAQSEHETRQENGSPVEGFEVWRRGHNEDNMYGDSEEDVTERVPNSVLSKENEKEDEKEENRENDTGVETPGIWWTYGKVYALLLVLSLVAALALLYLWRKKGDVEEMTPLIPSQYPTQYELTP